MAIDITPFLTPYTPPGAGYSPTGPYGRHLVAVTEKFAGLADKRRAQELEDAKLRLQQETLGESKRAAEARELTNRGILAESKRSAVAREGDASLTQIRIRRKQAATLYKSAKAMDAAGDHEASKILLSLAGFKVEELQSPAEVTAAVEGLGQAVATAEATAEMLGEPGDPLTKQEKLDKLGAPPPPPLPGMDPAGQLAGAVPRETLPAAAAPPLPGAPPVAGQMPVISPPSMAGQMPVVSPPRGAGDMPVVSPRAAYDPSQVPVGMAPPDMTREQYEVAERAQEPAYAHVPALPALPMGDGLGLGDMAPPVEQAGANIAASERAPEMRITTPFGETLDYSPMARNEEIRGQVNDFFTRYMEGADPMDMPAAVQVRDMAEEALALHGGDAKATAKYLDTILDRKEKAIHADYRKEVGAEAAMALQGAKRSAQKGPVDARIYQAQTRIIEGQAKGLGYYKDTDSLDLLRKAQGLLETEHTNDIEAGYAHGRAITMIQRSMEKGVATDKDIDRAKFGYMSMGAKIKGWLSEKAHGRLEPAHIESIMGALLDLRIATLRHLQTVRNNLDRRGDSAPEGTIAQAYRDWTQGAFGVYGVRREQTQEESLANDIQRNNRDTLLDPRIQRIPDRDEVRGEADMIERAQGPEARRKFLQEQGVEDIDSTIDDLLMEGAGVAP